MRSTHLFTAALALTAGLALMPAVSNAQLVGGGLTGNVGGSLGNTAGAAGNVSGNFGGQIGEVSGELQSGTAASANADLSGATEATGNAADSVRGDLRQARRQTGDAYNAARRSAAVNSSVNADARTDNLRGMIDTQGSASIRTNPRAATGAAVNAGRSVADDTRAITGQVRDTASGAASTRVDADVNVQAKANKR